MEFKKATRTQARLRLAVTGTAGAGKTYSSLLLAAQFGQRIGLIDSERGSASKYAGREGLPDFDVLELEEKTPQEYIAAINVAARAGFDVLVIDSWSHAWLAALEIVDKMGGKSKFTSGWKFATPLVNKLVDAVLTYPGHVIATMRSKADYVLEQNERGQSTPRKVGMAPVAREGTDFEFDVVIDLTASGALTVSKTRYPEVHDRFATRDEIPKLGETLIRALSQGVEERAIVKLLSTVRLSTTSEDLAAVLAEAQAAKRLGHLTDDEIVTFKRAFAAQSHEIAGDA